MPAMRNGTAEEDAVRRSVGSESCRSGSGGCGSSYAHATPWPTARLRSVLPGSQEFALVVRLEASELPSPEVSARAATQRVLAEALTHESFCEMQWLFQWQWQRRHYGAALPKLCVPGWVIAVGTDEDLLQIFEVTSWHLHLGTGTWTFSGEENGGGFGWFRWAAEVVWQGPPGSARFGHMDIRKLKRLLTPLPPAPRPLGLSDLGQELLIALSASTFTVTLDSLLAHVRGRRAKSQHPLSVDAAESWAKAYVAREHGVDPVRLSTTKTRSEKDSVTITLEERPGDRVFTLSLKGRGPILDVEEVSHRRVR